MRLFNNCGKQGVFPNIWKMANFFSVHKKKNSKQLVDNYLLVSLLPIFSKMFEKLLFHSTYEFLDKNSLLNSNQSGFRPNDSSIHQLIVMTHDIFTAFNSNPSLEVRDAFLDLSKAFGRV